MRKRFYRVLVALSMTAILFVSGCGNDTSETETFPTETESTEEPETECEEESTIEETETEEEETADIAKIEYDPENHTYETYPTFITEFTFKDDILTVKTEDVGFEDYPIPEEMEFSFSYPVAENCEWVFDSNHNSHFDSFAFLLEGVAFELDLFKNGDSYYTKGEDLCKADNLFTFVVEDGKVVKVLSVGKSDTDVMGSNETSESEQKTGATAKSAETSKPTESPKTAHEHSYKSSIIENATCVNNGTRSFVCSTCGDSYTEAIPANGHNWVTQYEEIYHESKGEFQQVQIGYSDGYLECGYCGATFATHEELDTHCVNSGVREHALSSYWVHDGQPIYENQWVITVPEWTEQAPYNVCSICGARQ